MDYFSDGYWSAINDKENRTHTEVPQYVTVDCDEAIYSWLSGYSAGLDKAKESAAEKDE